MNVCLNFKIEFKLKLLETLYSEVEKAFSKFNLFCKPGCNLCCTTKIYATSLEVIYTLSHKAFKNKRLLDKISPPFLRPSYTNNQLLLAYKMGEEVSLQDEIENLNQIKPCPFLREDGLCYVYDNRPLMCRITASLKDCKKGEAFLPDYLFKIGTLALQIVENIDIGGIYGNFFELLIFMKKFLENPKAIEEIPPQFLSNFFLEELPLLPEEKEERNWVKELYSQKIENGKSFIESLLELKKLFDSQRSLSFLSEIV